MSKIITRSVRTCAVVVRAFDLEANRTVRKTGYCTPSMSDARALRKIQRDLGDRFRVISVVSRENKVARYYMSEETFIANAEKVIIDAEAKEEKENLK